MANAIYYNAEAFVVSSGPTQLAVNEATLTLEGSATAAYRLVETDQTSPAGRYQLKLSGDTLTIQRATSQTADPWASLQDLLTIDSEGAEFGVPLDIDSISHFVAHLVGYLTPGEVAGIVEWLQGHGPTADPDGYALITVAEGKLGIVPYWDYQ